MKMRWLYISPPLLRWLFILIKKLAVQRCCRYHFFITIDISPLRCIHSKMWVDIIVIEEKLAL